MIRTITIGNYISVQGVLKGFAPNGRAIVRVGNKEYTGKLISSVQADW